MKNVVLWVLVVCSFFGSIYANLRIRDLENGLRIERLTLEDVQKRTTRPVAEHRYRFERNGASLWRYDEATGESCQVTSNQIDKWSGGRCPEVQDPTDPMLRVFNQLALIDEKLCKDNPDSDSCKALLKERR